MEEGDPPAYVGVSLKPDDLAEGGKNLVAKVGMSNK